jgi:phosphinothricin acetyltransferase
MGQVLVRPGNAADLPQLTDLYNHYVRTSPATFDLAPVSLENRRVWLGHYGETGPHRLHVAVDDGALAGYATSGKLRDKPGYLVSVETTVYVHPDHVGRGVGRTLYEALFSAIRDEDVHRAFAAIVIPNPASVALHERFGFTPFALFREVGRKFGRYWNVQWFERPLP